MGNVCCTSAAIFRTLTTAADGCREVAVPEPPGRESLKGGVGLVTRVAVEGTFQNDTKVLKCPRPRTLCEVAVETTFQNVDWAHLRLASLSLYGSRFAAGYAQTQEHVACYKQSAVCPFRVSPNSLHSTVTNEELICAICLLKPGLFVFALPVLGVSDLEDELARVVAGEQHAYHFRVIFQPILAYTHTDARQVKTRGNDTDIA